MADELALSLFLEHEDRSMVIIHPTAIQSWLDPIQSIPFAGSEGGHFHVVPPVASDGLSKRCVGCDNRGRHP